MNVGTYLLIIVGLVLGVGLANIAAENAKYKGPAMVFGGLCCAAALIMLIPVIIVVYFIGFIVIIVGAKSLLSS